MTRVAILAIWDKPFVIGLDYGTTPRSAASLINAADCSEIPASNRVLTYSHHPAGETASTATRPTTIPASMPRSTYRRPRQIHPRLPFPPTPWPPSVAPTSGLSCRYKPAPHPGAGTRPARALGCFRLPGQTRMPASFSERTIPASGASAIIIPHAARIPEQLPSFRRRHLIPSRFWAKCAAHPSRREPLAMPVYSVLPLLTVSPSANRSRSAAVIRRGVLRKPFQ